MASVLHNQVGSPLAPPPHSHSLVFGVTAAHKHVGHGRVCVYAHDGVTVPRASVLG